MKMKTNPILKLVVAVLLAVGAQSARSQNLIALSGKVTNGDKPLSGVQLVLTYQDNGKVIKVKTDKNGNYYIIGVARGLYTVEVLDASGQSLYQKKNQQVMGANGDSDKLDVDVAGAGGNAGQPKVTQEQIDAIKAQNAKAQSINALIAQYQAASAAKDWPGTVAPLQGMIAADPARWEYFQALGNSQSNMQDYENAVQTYDKGIQVAQGYVSGTTPRDPKNPTTDPAKAKLGMGQMLASQGNAYLKLKKNDEAIAAFTKAAELDPNPGVAYFNICATQYNTGNTEGAIVACDKAIAADPNKADAYFIKGSLLVAASTADSTGKVKPAPGCVESLKKYLELAPDGQHAGEVKQMLEYLGSTVDVNYKNPKKK